MTGGEDGVGRGELVAWPRPLPPSSFALNESFTGPGTAAQPPAATTHRWPRVCTGSRSPCGGGSACAVHSRIKSIKAYNILVTCGSTSKFQWIRSQVGGLAAAFFSSLLQLRIIAFEAMPRPPPGVKLYARLKGLDAKARRSTFDQWDVNGNGGLSLAEIDKAMVGSAVCCHSRGPCCHSL